jgi:tripartite-type tricarboxylate transporter receptor subunit TctC
MTLGQPREKTILTRIATIGACCAVIAAALTSASIAQTYPDRRITIVNGYPPGGPADAALRLLAKEMSLSMGQTIIVENRPGAQSAAAATAVVKSAPDGYTLLQCTTNTMLTMMLSKHVRYSFDDFAFISLMALNRYVVTVPASFPANSLKEFVAYVKERPGRFNHGHLGVGAADEIMGRAFLKSAGLELVGIPYSGQAPLAQALLSGEIHFAFGPVANVLPLHKEKNVKILAIAAEARVPEVGDVPTMREEGFNFDMAGGSWLGICAPKATPASIVDRLNAEIRKAVTSPDYRTRLGATGSAPISSESPQAFRSYMERFIKVWGATLADLKYERK